MIESSSLLAYHYYALLPKKANRLPSYILVWAGIVASGVASLLGYALFSHFSAEIIATTTAIAARAILAMRDTMIPESFEQVHDSALVDYCMRVSRRLCLK